jgi:hypothetical protein
MGESAVCTATSAVTDSSTGVKADRVMASTSIGSFAHACELQAWAKMPKIVNRETKVFALHVPTEICDRNARLLLEREKR